MSATDHLQSWFPVTDPESPNWQERLQSYGNDHPGVFQFINSYPSENTGNVVLVEIMSITGNPERRITKNCFRNVDEVKLFLCNIPDEPHVRAITVHYLTRGLIRLLGARFEMDYEMWTARFQPSDREYFAAPLDEKGPRHFSHFNLACVDFYRATIGNNGSSATPQAFLQNRHISHSVRLMRLIDTNPLKDFDATVGPRMYAIRRVSGHLRRDGSAWTFLFFCDQIPSFEDSHYVSDIPAKSMPCLPDWIVGSLSDQTPASYCERLVQDGFGLVVKVLREIKSSWKLLLCEFECFLEEINDNFNDDDFIKAAGFLGRGFLLNLDYFQRQLSYQQRYINFLISTPADEENSVVPVEFVEDLKQEANALLVVDDRLRALRDRTTTILNTILSLNSIKQARLASVMAQLQREDAAISFRQGESMRRLTLLNMFFLPPSLIAAIYGMNTNVTHDTQFWSFIFTAVTATSITIGFIMLKVQKVPQRGNIDAGRVYQPAESAHFFAKLWFWLQTHRLIIHKEKEA